MKQTILSLVLVLLSSNGLLLGNWSLYIVAEHNSAILSYPLIPKQTTQILLSSSIPTSSVITSLVLSPKREYLYALSKKSGSIIPFSLTSGVAHQGEPIFVDGAPTSMAIDPTGTNLYVVDASRSLLRSIGLTFSKPIASEPLAVGSNPYALAISPIKKIGYLCEYGKPSEGISGTLALIDLKALKRTATVNLDVYHPFAMCIDPDGSVGYIVASIANDTSMCAILVVNLSNTIPVISNTIRIPCSNFSKLVLSPTGDRLFVMNQDNATILCVDSLKNNPTLIDPIYVVHVPYDLLLTPDGSTLFVSFADCGNILPIDVSSSKFKFGEMLFLDGPGYKMAITSDQAPKASFSIQAAPRGKKTIFNAESSSTENGRIATYEWDFGDGTIHVSKRSSISHVYKKSGIYKVTLKVTNSNGSSLVPCFTGQFLMRQGSSMASLVKEVFIPSSHPPVRRP